MADRTPDLDLLRQLDDAEWREVEREYCGRLFAYALRRTGEQQAAEDVLQETMLGAVRGIGDFDEKFTFEQYLFGICRNRTIDHLRRRKPRTLQAAEEDEGRALLEQLAYEEETPSRIVRGRELGHRARELLGEILEDWVEETWSQREFTRLAVIEALLRGGWRNRDTWERFDLRDETAVAGIKFRALKRLRQLAAVRESGTDLLPALAASADGEEGVLDVDVRSVWIHRRVSCPARYWIACHVAGTLEPGPDAFVRFHLEDMACPWCLANRDDLAESGRRAELERLIERVRESRAMRLGSRRGSSTEAAGEGQGG